MAARPLETQGPVAAGEGIAEAIADAGVAEVASLNRESCVRKPRQPPAQAGGVERRGGLAVVRVVVAVIVGGRAVVELDVEALAVAGLEAAEYLIDSMAILKPLLVYLF